LSATSAKVVKADFDFPMSDGRLSLAPLCALQGRYEEASDWFAKAREFLAARGTRPLRSMADYDEALMLLRRAKSGDSEPACPFLAAALGQFQQLAMRGWIKSARALATTNSLIV
jgi:hypothetical protein